jgi:hypothetical protein
MKIKYHPTDNIEIKERRKIMKPSPVKLDHIPKWLVKLTDKHYGHQRFPNLDVCRGWIDHYGAAYDTEYGSLDGQLCFISEPYGLCTECYQNIDKFCMDLGLKWFASANSWHNPGRTFRIVIYQEEEK